MARLATAGPHVVPVTFALEGDVIVTAVDHKPKTTRRLRRLENIAADPRVSVLADHYEENWERLWWVRADGTARVVDEWPVDALTAKYPQYREIPPAGPFIVIDVHLWRDWTALPD
ncbi:TIGR03668 family PPOX class F420-dependent oxidoreductase [Herbidospora sp. NBRC 101105]|uniref:TIGR03668 family PPOX class F420-dependent oxidoreductase n=1 Tax=Herbidospora sp. NBRC 101105 TaxID=3032195 RepID=UPI0024A1AEB6|nr:TIGR03668 family PPOX class F420-dependent oxidoreductase [Herbidospora sp. NBRC 101105]GLX92402.1 PPOX class F420-dependent oxidoreductase [Herbidospora sp. NBRC 101105]